MKNVLDKIVDIIWEATKLVCDVVMISLFAMVMLIACAFITITGIFYGIYTRQSLSDSIHELFTEFWDMLTSDIDEEDEED